MDKKQFLAALRRALRDLPKEEREKFVLYYQEMIEDHMENGCTEQEAVAQVGDVQAIAADILREQDIFPPAKPRKRMPVWGWVLVVLGSPFWGPILAAVFCIVFSVYLIIWCIPVTSASVTVGLFAFGMLSLVGSPMVLLDAVPAGMFQIGAGVAALGLALFAGVATFYLAKVLGKGSVWGVRKMARACRGDWRRREA